MIDVVDIALSQVDVTESGGENRGLPFDRYGLPGEDALPWCARFVRWCFSMLGHPLPGNPYEIASVSNLQRAMDAKGAWMGNADLPRRGDLILLNERGHSDKLKVGHHIGIVHVVEGSTIHSIEGNWGNAVRRVSRTTDDNTIWGFARWPQEPSA